MKNKGFTTANEKQNKNKFLFYSSAVGEKTRSGFTLIELLVVISIISLLSSVVLVSVQDAREKAKATAFKQHVNELIKAIKLYQSNGNSFPEFNSITTLKNTFEIFGTINEEDYFDQTFKQYIDQFPMSPGGEIFHYAKSSRLCEGAEHMLLVHKNYSKYFENWFSWSNGNTFVCYPLYEY